MSDSFSPNIPSDEAAIMADENSTHPASLDNIDANGDDQGDEGEDPTGPGSKKKHPANVFSYRHRKEPVQQFRVRGGAFPTTKFGKTPGAKKINP